MNRTTLCVAWSGTTVHHEKVVPVTLAPSSKKWFLLHLRLQKITGLSLEEIKTKLMVGILNQLNVDASALIVTAEKNDNIIRSANNIPGVSTALTNTINVYDILRHEKLILTKDAVTKIEEVYV